MKDSKVLKAGMGYTIGNYMLKGLNFFTIPIFAYLLSPSDYGYYNIFVAYETIVFILLGFGIHTSYKNARYKYRYVSEGADKGGDYKTYVSTTMLLLLGSMFMWLCCANLFSKLISGFIGLDQISINMLICYSWATAVFQCFTADIGIEYKFKSFLAVSFFNAIGNITLSILLICTVFSEKRYMGRIVGCTVPLVILAIFITYKYLKESKPKSAKKFLSWGLRYSMPTIPHGIGQVILSQFDRIMIERIVSSVASGIYSFAYNINIILNVTTQSMDNVWNPWFYERMNQKDYESIKKVSSIYSIAVCIFSSILILVSPELVKLLGSNEYEDAIYCVAPIVASGFLAFLYTLPSAVEYYYEKTKYIAVGTIGAAVINIILNVLFINLYGYVAAAYTTLFTYVIYFVFHYILAKRIHGYSIFSNKVMILNITAIIAVMLSTVWMLDFLSVRWFLAIILGVILIIIEEKNVGIIKKILKSKKENANE